MATIKTPEPLIRPYRYKPEVRVAARDIDTYARPQQTRIGAPVGETSLESLAGALRDSSPVLLAYFKTKEAQKQNDLLAKGMRMQVETSMKSWGDLIRQHPEAEKYSPWVREGFEKQAAVAKGADYQLYLMGLMTSDETLAGMTDQSQINDYINQKTEDWMKQNTSDLNDRAIATQFVPIVEKTRQEFGVDFAKAKLNQTLQDKYDKYGEAVSKSTQAFMIGNSDVIKKGGADSDALAAQLAAQISINAENTILDVSNPQKINDATIDTVTTLLKTASAEQIPFLKKVAENLTGRDGAKLTGIVKYQDKYQQAVKEAYSNVIYQEQVKEAQLKIDSQDFMKAAYLQISKNPTADYGQLRTKAIQLYGPEAGTQIDSWSKACLSGVAQRRSFFDYGGLSGGGGGGSAGGSSGPADRMEKFSVYSTLMSGDYTKEQVASWVAAKYLTPAQGATAVSNIGKPDKTVLNVVEAVSGPLYAYCEDPKKSFQGMHDVAAINADLIQTAVNYKTTFSAANGRPPTPEEMQTYMIGYAEKKAQLMEKTQAVQAQKQKFLSDASKGKGSQSLTKDSLQVLIDDYNKNGGSSSLAKLKDSSNQNYRRMSMDDFIYYLATSNGIKISGYHAPAPTPQPDHFKSQPHRRT